MNQNTHLFFMRAWISPSSNQTPIRRARHPPCYRRKKDALSELQQLRDEEGLFAAIFQRTSEASTEGITMQQYHQSGRVSIIHRRLSGANA
ncbi:hypothetical protein HOLleu_37883 [Holothuria leucospilota]|uniref:Uncharacterized protein n=1 Tax=Holothuria leucospilota TaxID=206669 RepID=A0A9Q1BCQ2_HOLLE|nr:hypothetical protein HOLleu_37883 [Holothuria leucospilota]